MVVLLSIGVVKVVPDPNSVPPVAASNHLMVGEEAVAFKVKLPVPHRDAPEVELIVGTVLMVMVTATLAELHPFKVEPTQ